MSSGTASRSTTGRSSSTTRSSSSGALHRPPKSDLSRLAIPRAGFGGGGGGGGDFAAAGASSGRSFLGGGGPLSAYQRSTGRGGSISDSSTAIARHTPPGPSVVWPDSITGPL